MKEDILNKIEKNIRITPEEGRFLFDCDLGFTGKLATTVKKRFHPDDIATYIVDININITNICSSKCGFCAFYVDEDSEKAFLLSKEEIIEKVAGLVKLGGTQVMLQGGINKNLTLSYYTEILEALKKNFDVYIHAFSPAEISYLSQKENLSIEDTLCELRKSGLDSLPGGGAEILSDRVRNRISPMKISADEWLEIMRTAHSIGMKSTATMMFGITETLDERIEHLEKIRSLQDKTEGFRAFIPWTFSPANTEFSDIIRAGGAEYLKTLAISRIYLDNIVNVGSGWLTEGMQVAQLGLSFGANDMGGVLLEEKVLKAAGVNNKTGIDEMRSVIKAAAMKPVQRNTEYNHIEA